LEYSEIGRLQDRLTGALIGLAKATDGNEHLISQEATAVFAESLAATRIYGEGDADHLQVLLTRAAQEKQRMVPNCFCCASPCGRTSDYPLEKLNALPETERSLKQLLLLGIRGIAVDVCRAAVRGCHDEAAEHFFYKALVFVGMAEATEEMLLAVVQELGVVSLRARKLLDKALLPQHCDSADII